MSEVDQFIASMPVGFRDIEGAEPYFRFLHLFLEDLRTRTGGETDVVEATAGEVVTLGGTVAANTASSAANTASLASLLNSLPAYSISNDGTDRTFNADAAVNGTGIDVADAGPTNVALLSDHDALVAVVQEHADVIATVIRDMVAKNVLGV